MLKTFVALTVENQPYRPVLWFKRYFHSAQSRYTCLVNAFWPRPPEAFVVIDKYETATRRNKSTAATAGLNTGLCKKAFRVATVTLRANLTGHTAHGQILAP